MPKSELILCIETSSKLLSIALWQDGVVLDNIKHFGAKVHNEHLLPSIKKILENANFSLNNLTGIACGIGPGSFTGLRIGCAAIQGLAFSLDIPVYTCSSLRLIAQEYYLKNKNKNKILIILDANAGDFYIGKYIIKNNLAVSLDINLSSDILLNKQEVIDYINNNNFDAYIGDAAGEFSISNNNANNSNNSNNSNKLKKLNKLDDIYYPTACALCELLSELLKFPIDPENLEPVYLRTEKHWEKK